MGGVSVARKAGRKGAERQARRPCDPHHVVMFSQRVPCRLGLTVSFLRGPSPPSGVSAEAAPSQTPRNRRSGTRRASRPVT